MDDSASVLTTNPAPLLVNAEAKSIAPLLNENSSLDTQIAQFVLAHITNAAGEKIVMTSTPVAAGPPKTLVDRITRPKTKPKIVLMPESEYNKYFAKD
jgi:hypothetical protein